MRARGAEAGDVERLACAELLPRQRKPRLGEPGVELMNARSAHREPGKPACKMKSGPAKPWMSRTDAPLSQQTLNPLFRPRINHK